MTQSTTLRIRIKTPLDEEDEPRLGHPSARVEEPEDPLPSGPRYQPLWGRIITALLALVGIVVIALALLVPKEDQPPPGVVAKGPAAESPVARAPLTDAPGAEPSVLESPPLPGQPPPADTARITPAPPPAPATTEEPAAGTEPPRTTRESAEPPKPVSSDLTPGETPPPSAAVTREAGGQVGTAPLPPSTPGEGTPGVRESPEPVAVVPEPVAEAPAGTGTPPPAKEVSTGIAPPPTAEEAPSPDLPYRVARAQFTSGMRGREPMDSLGPTISPSSTGSKGIYYFTELRDMQGHTAIHRWEHEGHTVARVRFSVRGGRWRVYSSKVLPGAMRGEWRVTVTDEQGRVLRTDDFRYE